ncbi:recombinase family protein [Priestia flexa]|uniref:recombinase family protein n=1 Tax=Priestia flexa TaxID=86664 RepID=UPI003F68A4FD
MNVVGYIRVSTQGQARDGYSLKYQEDEIKVYCKENGWNLKHIYRDKELAVPPPRNSMKVPQPFMCVRSQLCRTWDWITV